MVLPGEERVTLAPPLAQNAESSLLRDEFPPSLYPLRESSNLFGLQNFAVPWRYLGMLPDMQNHRPSQINEKIFPSH
jgi:hypothetical protein